MTPSPENETTRKLRNYIERIERVKAEAKELTDDIKDIFAQAKSDGFDVKIMRHVLKLRTLSKAERQEAQHLLDTYMAAVDPQMSLFEERVEEPA
jgi:uncharacterized protein (UPF0335 family)